MTGLRCPYCGSNAPYGDERNLWLFAHLDSRSHRVWQRFKVWLTRSNRS